MQRIVEVLSGGGGGGGGGEGGGDLPEELETELTPEVMARIEMQLIKAVMANGQLKASVCVCVCVCVCERMYTCASMYMYYVCIESNVYISVDTICMLLVLGGMSDSFPS